MDCDSAGFWVEFPFPASADAEKTSVITPVETLVKAWVKAPTAILQCLTSDPTLALTEVAAQIGKSVSAVERASAKLVTQGKLNYVGPKKSGHWEVLI